MIKIVMIVLISIVLVIFLRDVNKEFAFFVTIASSILLFSVVISEFYDVISSIFLMSESIGSINSYVKLMIKILVLVLISQFVIDLCRDNGENTLASQTELASKIIILVMVMPLFNSVLNIITGLLK